MSRFFDTVGFKLEFATSAALLFHYEWFVEQLWEENLNHSC